MSQAQGYVEKYPCDCQGGGAHICWIVRHPNCNPPISYRSKSAATRALNLLRRKDPRDSKTL